MSPRFILGRENVSCVAEVVNKWLKADCADFNCVNSMFRYLHFHLKAGFCWALIVHCRALIVHENLYLGVSLALNLLSGRSLRILKPVTSVSVRYGRSVFSCTSVLYISVTREKHYKYRLVRFILNYPAFFIGW